MYDAKPDDEIDGITGYLDQQLDAIRASVIGLTEEQARSRPCRSTLSLVGLVTHATYGMRGALERLGRIATTGAAEVPEGAAFDEAGFAAYTGSFDLAEGESVADALAAFDQVRVDFLAAVRAADPSAEVVEDPAPWIGVFDRRPARLRYDLVHQIEELARHAGHADILREQIDGVAVPAIVLSLEGMAASSFFEPYVPAPGTIGAA
jgi:hypothetical protein